LGGLKFRRQHPIEPFVVDFYCATANFTVELDGENHEGRQDYDADREIFLHKLGIRIIRVTNDDVLNNLDGVAEFILRETTQHTIEPSPNPSLKGRGI
jgi:very-short-patch-repair endonuclease